MDHKAFCRRGALARLFLAVMACLLAGLGNAQAFEASFDCAKAEKPVENLICSNAVLADEDVRMAHTYQFIRQRAPEEVQDQRQWLQDRNACQDFACVKRQYDERRVHFSEILGIINARSGNTPFYVRQAPPAVPSATPANIPTAPANPVPEAGVSPQHDMQQAIPAPATKAPTEDELQRRHFDEVVRELHSRQEPSATPNPVSANPTPPVETVSTWQKTQGYIADKIGFLVAAALAALAYFLWQSQWVGRLVKEYVDLLTNTRFYKKASRLVQDFQERLEYSETENPIAALLGVVAVAFLSKMAVNDFNALAYNLILNGFNTSYSWGFNAYLEILRDIVEYSIIFFVLFWLACVPFCIGVLVGLVQDVFGDYSYPAALLPFGLEAAVVVYMAFFRQATVVAWVVKWRRRKEALQTVLGIAAYLLVVYLVGQFVAAQHGVFSQTLVWVVAAILFGIWIKKTRKPPETRLFDATLEPEKYFKNEGVVLGWCHCNIPEPSANEDEDLIPYERIPHVLRYKTDKHFLSIMPNRSGKGRSQIIPNLLQLADWSCWVVDPKGENALTTAPWRRDQGHEIVIINPKGLRAAEFKARGFATFQTFNPLLNLDPASDRFVGDVDALADALIYNTGGDSHWSEGARGLVSLLIMYLVTEPTETPTFRRLRALIAGGYDSLAVAFGLMAESPFDLVRENVGRYDKLSEETESLIATAETQTGIFRNKTLCAALDGGAFDFEAMKHKKMTVYMILPAEYLVTQARFLRLILLSAMSQFTRSEEGKYRIMVLLDEFANLGPLQMVEQGAALISGYGVTLWPFVQNLSQLQKLYPNNWEVFIANAAAITVANVNDVTTAEYFSKRAGKTIKHLWSWSSSSTSGERASSTSGHSKSESIQDILPVEDIYNLRGDSGYVFFEGKAPPLIALKSNYDDKRLPWHGRAAENPMVKVWR